MCQKIDLNSYKVSIFDEEGKSVKDTKIEVGKRLTISNEQNWKFGIIVESQQNDNVKGEVFFASFELFKNTAKNTIQPLSVNEKVELTHKFFVKK